MAPTAGTRRACLPRPRSRDSLCEAASLPALQTRKLRHREGGTQSQVTQSGAQCRLGREATVSCDRKAEGRRPPGALCAPLCRVPDPPWRPRNLGTPPHSRGARDAAQAPAGPPPHRADFPGSVPVPWGHGHSVCRPRGWQALLCWGYRAPDWGRGTSEVHLVSATPCHCVQLCH